MRLGKVQRSVYEFLRQSGGRCYIGPSTCDPELYGLDLNQVERALEGMRARGIVKERGAGFWEIKKPGNNA